MARSPADPKRPGKRPRARAATVGIQQLPHAAGLPLPAYQSDEAAGLDLVAAIAEPLTLQPGQRALLPTGLVMELARGYEGQVRPRSGLALKSGVTVLNSPGTIDSDYRGEIGVVLVNLGEAPVTISRGDRIAQLVIAPAVQARLVPKAALSRTKRAGGGFGSTGGRPKAAAKP